RDFEEGALYPSQAHPKKLKEMLDQAAAQPTSDQEQQLAKDIQKYVIDTQCLVVPFGVNTMPSAKSPKVHDDGIDAPSAQQWFPSNVWISK
ncbi:MAG: hypothetical protein K6T83_16340, partial [Alicyclobacillus sp.]|nr:hypothetical protein [Alicyclobacillus sp.]